MNPATDNPARARAESTLAQREAALPQRSVWVAASAGSGKTKVLTDRVLSLLLAGSAPERILALTFTKAAAAEMANRLASRLANWATLDAANLSTALEELLGRSPENEELERARRLFARVLDTAGGLKIQTIHAFCQSLLARFPLEAGLAPHFQVLEENSATEMLEEAREETLAEAMSGEAPKLAEAVAIVASHAQEQSFVELSHELVFERARLLQLFARHGGVEGVIAKLARALAVEPDAQPDGLLAEACEDPAFDAMALKVAILAYRQGSTTDREKAAQIESWIAADAIERRRAFARYVGVFLTQKGEITKRLITKKALEAEPSAESALSAEAERLLSLAQAVNSATVLRASAALLRLASEIFARYDERKRARALLDYDDLILKTRDLLAGEGAAGWVLYKLDGGLDHLLVDEAQDTNPEQWAVIRALTKEFFVGAGAHEETSESPRTVFAVGDAKQSIFSFQRADPEAFRAMGRYFAKRAEEMRQAWSEVSLGVSFRSTASILKLVDAVFADPAAQDGVIFDGETLRHLPVRAGQAGLVELWPPAPAADPPEVEPWAPPGEADAELPSQTRLAKVLAARIRHWTLDPAGAKDPDCRLPARERRIRPGDILVLVRRRNAFVEELVRALKQTQVPVAGVDRMTLSDQLAVADLVALGRFLLLPEDDLTLAVLLKSPLIGLDEEALFALAYRRENSLWRSLQAKAKERAAFAAAAAQLSAWLARANFVPPYELFAEVLGPGRGREKLLSRLGPEANDPLDELLNAALTYEREHVPSLEGFLHWLAAGELEVKRDLEQGHDEVRVMTVHGAKGLQAPLVILPDTLQGPPPKRGLLWADIGETDALPLWPLRKDYDGPLAAAARDTERVARAREYRRLLYVALTRAEDRLYLCGYQTRNDPPADCWYNLVARNLSGISEAAAFDFSKEVSGGWSGPGWRLAAAQSAQPAGELVRDTMPKASPLPDWAKRAAAEEPDPPRPLAPSRPRDEEPPAASPLADDKELRFRRGRIVHRLLQHLPGVAPAARAEVAERVVARDGGLDPKTRVEIVTATLRVLADLRFAPLFGHGSRAEVPLIGLIEGIQGRQVVAGQVDRLVVRDDRILLVDYKTNREPPTDEAGIPALYLRQLAAYRAVLERIYPGRPVDCFLLWTEGPRLTQITPQALEAHAP
ncbi:MAG: double-strand break repair helicase AddA [Kiloniellales bacterium]